MKSVVGGLGFEANIVKASHFEEYKEQICYIIGETPSTQEFLILFLNIVGSHNWWLWNVGIVH